MSETAKIKNLWGDLPLEKNIRTPYIILREQASILTDATDGLLVGTVNKEKYQNDEGEQLSHCTLVIEVPSMNNYSISIVEVFYPVTIYPSIIYNNLVKDANGRKCKNEQDIDLFLEEILSSSTVSRTISGLMSEVRLDVENEQ